MGHSLELCGPHQSLICKLRLRATSHLLESKKVSSLYEQVTNPSPEQIPSASKPHVMPTPWCWVLLSLYPPDISLIYLGKQGLAKRTCTPQTKVKGRQNRA